MTGHLRNRRYQLRPVRATAPFSQKTRRLSGSEGELQTNHPRRFHKRRHCETFADGSFAALLGGKPRGLRGHRGDPGAEDQHGLLHHRGGLRQCEELQQREVGSSRVRSQEVTASSLCNVVPGPRGVAGEYRVQGHREMSNKP